MSKRHLYWLTGALTFVGVVMFLYKVVVLGFPLAPGMFTRAWQVEAQIEFEAIEGPAKVTFFIPRSTSRHTVYDQTFVTRGFGLKTRSVDDNRAAIFSIRKASGVQTLYYRALIHRTDARDEPVPSPPPPIERSGYEGMEAAAAESIARQVFEQSADTASMIAILIHRLRNAKPGDEAALLLGPLPSQRKLVRTAVRILRQARIPARMVTGIGLLDERRDARPVHWLEVYDDDRWRPFEASEGNPGAPAGHVAWWRGNSRAAKVEGGSDVKVNFAVSRTLELALRAALKRGRLAQEDILNVSLFGLPNQTQEVYKILLVVPLGVFILVILRNVVGLRTFGTFMPVLIALAFRETQLLWGIALFSLIVGLGLAIRFYLERLKLLLVPRLATIVIAVVLLMAAFSVISHKLGIERGLSIALFPMVIMTMTIERMTIVWDELGPAQAFKQAFGSLAVAVLCYLVMNYRPLGHLAFVFPELLLVVLAATLLLGRYAGYRLLDLPRFKVLAGKA